MHRPMNRLSHKRCECFYDDDRPRGEKEACGFSTRAAAKTNTSSNNDFKPREAAELICISDNHLHIQGKGTRSDDHPELYCTAIMVEHDRVKLPARRPCGFVWSIA